MSCFHCIAKSLSEIGKFSGLEFFEENKEESRFIILLWKIYTTLCFSQTWLSILIDGILIILPLELVHQISYGTLIAFKEGIIHRLIQDLSLFLNLYCCFVTYRSKRYKNMMQKFFRLWKATKSSKYEEQLENDLRKWQNYLFFILCSIIFTVCSLNILLIISPVNRKLFYGSYLQTIKELFIFIAYLARLCFSVVSLSISLSFYAFICIAIRFKFRYLHKELKELKNDKEKVENYLKSLQIRHYLLTEMVLIVDECFNCLMFVNIACSISYICSSAFPALYVKTDIYIKLVLVTWTLFGLLSLILTSLVTSFIGEEAHKPYKIIIHLNSRDLDQELKLKLQMFLKRLGGPKIGISCLDMFVISRGSILNILNALITYFLILIQLQQIKSSN